MLRKLIRGIGILLAAALWTLGLTAHALPGEGTVRIMMPIGLGRNQVKQLSYARQLLEKEGFDIQFEVFKKNGTEYYAAYEQFIMDNLDQSDWVFVIPSNGMDIRLNRGGALTDLYDLGIEYAPKYTIEYAGLTNDMGELKVMPVGIRPLNMERLAVLIRNDVYDAYGQEVRTASEYKALLTCIRDELSMDMPGAIGMNIALTYHEAQNYRPIETDYQESRYTALSLFLPEQGYDLLDNIYQAYPTNAALVYDIGERRVYAPYDLPLVADSMAELLSWRESGLMDYASYDTPFQNYATLLVNTGAILGGNLRSHFPHQPESYTSLDLSRYHISLLYPDQTIRDTQGSEYIAKTCAVASKNANVSEFLRFMEWLEDEENYEYFRYGVVGEDYEIADGWRVYLRNPVKYDQWEQRDFFQRVHKERLPPGDMPVNFEEEMAGIRFTADLPIDSDVMKAIYREWMANDGMRETIDITLWTFMRITRLTFEYQKNEETDEYRDRLLAWLEDDRPMDAMVEELNRAVDVSPYDYAP